LGGKVREGAQVVVWVWVFACLTSAVIFVIAGFSDPANTQNYFLFRKFTDTFYESMSGFTTIGAGVLPMVEVYSRGILFWRSMTHLLGGMGIVYLALTLLKKLKFSREEVLNGETESPLVVHFEEEKEIVESGYDFLKICSLLAGILSILLILSGYFFRLTPYQTWYDNVFDSLIHTMGTLGTGGFSTYDTSVGLTANINGVTSIGGL
jgi:trk system potassium uptake protein TrkH